MPGFRKFLVSLLAIVLFIFLLGLAWSTSFDLTFSKPAKLESWLAQSKVYDHFVDGIVEQSQKSETGAGQDQGGGSQLSDPGVQQAAKDAFNPQLLQTNVNSFIDSNYAWLQGKTTKPDFKIDFTTAKQTFAQKVGQYVTTRLQTLPACPAGTPLQDFDGLVATCLPKGITPAAAGAQTEQKLAGSGEFLGNSLITADNINPDNNAKGTPYYQKLSQLPKAYRLATATPFILLGLVVLTVLGIIFIHPSRRKGLRRVATTLLVAGILLVIPIFLVGTVTKRVETKIFNNATVGELQTSLADVAHRASSSFVRSDLYLGIAFVVIAVALYLVLRFTRPKTGAPAHHHPNDSTPSAETPTDSEPPTSGPPGTPSGPSTVPRTKKRPVLIQ